MSSLSERLRTARLLAHDLGTRELDRLAGLTEGHTSAIETGTRPNVEVRTATALASVLGVSLDWLANGEGRAPGERSVREAVNAARSTRSSTDAA
jgi:transcriptional regulator with XRE-family HTH domain